MVQLVDVYILVLAITAILALGVAFGAWMQRKSSQAWPLVVLMLGLAAWSGAEAAMWSQPTLSRQLFWLMLTYPGVSVVMIAFVVFAFDTAELHTWTTPRLIAYMSVPLTLVTIMAMTDPGGLFYAGFKPQQIGSYTHYVAQNGALFWVYVLVAWGAFLVGLFVIVRAHIRSTPAKRSQTRIVMLAVIVPAVVSVVNMFAPSPIEGIESTAFFLTGVVFLFALIRGQLLHPSGHVVTAQDVLEAEGRELSLQTSNRELGDRLEASKHRADRLYDQATHDPLTNLSNRRALEDDLVREVARSQRTNAPIAFLMFDLDAFKAVNDTYSHLAGDAALKMVSEVLLRGSRQVDVMCRWGGDEFLVVMPGADSETGCRRAEELRDEIGSTLIRFDGAEFSITTTIGVSVFPTHGTTSTLAVLAADQALLFAKNRGGNRTAVADWDGPRMVAQDC